MDTVSEHNTTGVQDVAVTFATRIGLFLFGIVIQSLLAYALLPTGRGAFAVCILFIGLVGVLLSPGADVGAQYFVIARSMSVSQGVSVALTICLVGAGLAAVLTIPLINSNVPLFLKADPEYFYLALVLIPLSTFAGAVQHQLLGLRRFGRLALYSLIQTSANVLVLACLVLGLGLGVNGALVASGVSYAVMIVSCLSDLRKNAGLAWEAPSGSAIARVLRYGLRYHVARIGSTVDARMGILLLGGIAGPDEVGVFAVASGLIMRFMVISNAVAVPLLPPARRAINMVVPSWLLSALGSLPGPPVLLWSRCCSLAPISFAYCSLVRFSRRYRF